MGYNDVSSWPRESLIELHAAPAAPCLGRCRCAGCRADAGGGTIGYSLAATVASPGGSSRGLLGILGNGLWNGWWTSCLMLMVGWWLVMDTSDQTMVQWWPGCWFTVNLWWLLMLVLCWSMICLVVVNDDGKWWFMAAVLQPARLWRFMAGYDQCSCYSGIGSRPRLLFHDGNSSPTKASFSGWFDSEWSILDNQWLMMVILTMIDDWLTNTGQY